MEKAPLPPAQMPERYSTLPLRSISRAAIATADRNRMCHAHSLCWSAIRGRVSRDSVDLRTEAALARCTKGKAAISLVLGPQGGCETMNRFDRKLMGVWSRWGTKVLPFADVASDDLPLSRLLRLSLIQFSVGVSLERFPFIPVHSRRI